MDPRQRFKLDRPCPVCAGHEDMPHRERSRCYGFLSDDGLYAHCTREEYAGYLERNEGSNGFAHLLDGACRCGRDHDAKSTQAPSVPNPKHIPYVSLEHLSSNNAGNAPGTLSPSRRGNHSPSLESYKDRKMGKLDQYWTYYDAEGMFACHIARWNTPDGKEYRPLTLTEKGNWQKKGIPKPRPLYNVPALLERPYTLVLVVEGEKTSDAASHLFPSHVATTSMGGANRRT